LKLCPYNRKKITQISQYTNDLADDVNGVIKSNKAVLSETYELMECSEENCGAYFNGRCNYTILGERT
jgi:hypothetical protein